MATGGNYKLYASIVANMAHLHATMSANVPAACDALMESKRFALRQAVDRIADCRLARPFYHKHTKIRLAECSARWEIPHEACMIPESKRNAGIAEECETSFALFQDLPKTKDIAAVIKRTRRIAEQEARKLYVCRKLGHLLWPELSKWTKLQLRPPKRWSLISTEEAEAVYLVAKEVTNLHNSLRGPITDQCVIRLSCDFTDMLNEVLQAIDAGLKRQPLQWNAPEYALQAAYPLAGRLGKKPRLRQDETIKTKPEREGEWDILGRRLSVAYPSLFGHI